MDRVTDFESGGCAFDPHRGHSSSYMPNPQAELQLIHLLADRLERISADSVWAHRASGVRGTLLRALDESHNENIPDSKVVKNAIIIAFNILTKAAKRS